MYNERRVIYGSNAALEHQQLKFGAIYGICARTRYKKKNTDRPSGQNSEEGIPKLASHCKLNL